MKASHHAPTSAPTIWVHMSEIPSDVRTILDAELDRGETEDKAIIATTVTAIRQSRLSMRIPKMCRALRVTLPELPKRRVFVAVALMTGLSEGHVRDLYYAERRKA